MDIEMPKKLSVDIRLPQSDRQRLFGYNRAIDECKLYIAKMQNKCECCCDKCDCGCIDSCPVHRAKILDVERMYNALNNACSENGIQPFQLKFRAIAKAIVKELSRE